MKYMVMECHPGYAVVLGEDGQFHKVANMRYEVGQTVTNVTELQLPKVAVQFPKSAGRRWLSSLAAVAACLVLVLSSVFLTGQLPYASVYLSINPQVRIDVNRKDVVVGVAGINSDGEQLLEGYEFRQKGLDLVMDELVDRAIDMGYLHEGGKISLSIEADDEWIVSHREHLSNQLNNYLEEKITVTIDVEQVGPQQDSATVPSDPVGIPDGPEHYGDSDYGETAPDGDDSGYGDVEADDSPYDEPDEDGQTDYGTAGDVPPEVGASDYDPEDGSDDDCDDEPDDMDEGNSDYDEDDREEADSEYGGL